jgi:hypothetical protein
VTVPLHRLGTGRDTERLIRVCSRLCDRTVGPGEDASAVTAEMLERVSDRLMLLERAVAAKLGRPREP